MFRADGTPSATPRRRWLRMLAFGAALFAAGYALVGWLRPQWVLDAEYARQRLFAGATEHELAVADHRWRYLEAGSGPVLVLVHGFTGSKENWLPVVGALSAHHRVIVPDLPGWGDSERRDGATYGFAEQAARLADFIDAIADEPVVLVGHSMGGGIAALLAAEHPERVAKVVLLDAAGVQFDNAFAREVLAGRHPFAVADRDEFRRYMHLVFDDPPWVPWPADRAFVQRRIRDDAFERGVLALIGTEAQGNAPGIAAAKIAAPTLLLWCRNDRVIDVKAADVYAAAIPHAQKQLLDGCNHMPMMEQPARTAEALHAFATTNAAQRR